VHDGAHISFPVEMVCTQIFPTAQHTPAHATRPDGQALDPLLVDDVPPPLEFPDPDDVPEPPSVSAGPPEPVSPPTQATTTHIAIAAAPIVERVMKAPADDLAHAVMKTTDFAANLRRTVGQRWMPETAKAPRGLGTASQVHEQRPVWRQSRAPGWN